MVRCGVVWCGVVCGVYEVVWHGVVWMFTILGWVQVKCTGRCKQWSGVMVARWGTVEYIGWRHHIAELTVGFILVPATVNMLNTF